MATKEQNTMMAKRMKQEGTGKWPNSISLSHGWQGSGADDRIRARQMGRNMETSGKNMIGLLGGVLAERIGYKSPIKLPA